MKYLYADSWNYMLSRKCDCGGEAEMLVDFVDDFVVRCSRCYLSTHAYMDPEQAAAHWNIGDDIMSNPCHIFQDNPDNYLAGEIVAIHIADEQFDPVTQQSADFMEAVIEYPDRKIIVAHHDYFRDYSVDVEKIDSFDSKIYRHRIRPAKDERIKFEKVVFDDAGEVERLEFRWDDSWLFIIAEKDNLVIARDIVPYAEESPSIDGDYPLTWTS